MYIIFRCCVSVCNSCFYPSRSHSHWCTRTHTNMLSTLNSLVIRQANHSLFGLLAAKDFGKRRQLKCFLNSKDGNRPEESFSFFLFFLEARGRTSVQRMQKRRIWVCEIVSAAAVKKGFWRCSSQTAERRLKLLLIHCFYHLAAAVTLI